LKGGELRELHWDGEDGRVPLVGEETSGWRARCAHGIRRQDSPRTQASDLDFEASVVYIYRAFVVVERTALAYCVVPTR
jgi:hypothetical protein